MADDYGAALALPPASPYGAALPVASPYGTDATAPFGGMPMSDMIALAQQYQQAQQQPAPEPPLDTRVPTDQFVDLPTFQQQIAPNMSAGDAYDMYRDVILPKQLADMGMPPANVKQSVANFVASSPRPVERGVLGELGNTLMSGWDLAAQDTKGVAERYLPDWLVQGIEDTGKKLGMGNVEDISKQRLQDMTPEMKAALAKEWVHEDAQGNKSMGPAFGDWRSYVGGALQSLPEQAVGYAGGRVASAAGAALGLAGKAAKALTWFGGSTPEGLLAGEQSSREVTDYVMNAPQSVMDGSKVYQDLRASGKTDQEARKQIASDRATQAYINVAASTIALGGHGDVVLDSVIKGETKGIIKRGIKAGTGEAIEEFPQGYSQQVFENIAKQAVDPTIPTTQGALNQGVGGAVLGFAQGGGMGAAFGHNPLEQGKPAETPAVTPDVPITPEGQLAVNTAAAIAARQAAIPANESTPEEDRTILRDTLVNAGVRAALQTTGVTVKENQYQKELDPIDQVADPKDAPAAIRQAIDSLQGRTGKQAEATVSALQDIHDQLVAQQTLEQTQGALAGTPTATTPRVQGETPVQDTIRNVLNIRTGADRQAANDAWMAHFATLDAIQNATQAAAAHANMEAERASLLDQHVQQQTAAGATPAASLSPRIVSESTSRVENALKALPQRNQTAIRQRANQILQDTVNAANQRANQRGNAGNPRTQLGASGGLDLAGGRAGSGGLVVEGGAAGSGGGGGFAGLGGGRRGLGGLGSRQRAAVGTAGHIPGTATGTGGTLADRLIAQVEAGQADPRLLSLLVIADEETKAFLAESGAAVPETPPPRVPTPPAPTPPRTLKRGPAAVVGGFSTAKGSTYQVHPDGTTTRDKAARPEHPGEKERGVQPRSQVTFYVDHDLAQRRLSLIQATTPHKIALTVNPDGTHAGLMWTTGPQAGKMIDNTIVPISKTPQAGLIPVEGWRTGITGGTGTEYDNVHFGNPITTIEGPSNAQSAKTTDAGTPTTTGAIADAQTVKPNPSPADAAQVGTLKRGRAAATPLAPAPPGSIGASLLSNATAISERLRRGRTKAEAGPTGVVRPSSIAEKLASVGLGRADAGTGRRTGNLRRGKSNADAVPKRTRRTAADTTSLAQKQDLTDSLVAKYGFSRAQAWGLVEAQGTTAPDIVHKAAAELAAKKETVDALVQDHGVPRAEAWKLVEADSNELWQPSTTVSDEDLQNVGPAGGGTSTNVTEAVNAGDVHATLDALKTALPDELQRAVAGRLQDVGVTASIEMGELPGRIKGQYSPSTNSITIDPVKGDDATVLHEVSHAGTQAALRNPQTPEQKAAAKRMNQLFEYAKAHPNSTGMQDARGFHSVEEFVAEAFSNKDFQDHLRGIPLPGESTHGPMNALSAFKKFVLNLLGVRSVLSETLMTGEDLLDSRVFSLSANLQNEAAAEKNQQTGKAYAGTPSDALTAMNPQTGERTAIAYLNKDGKTYNYYEATHDEPKGVKGTRIEKLTRQQVEDLISENGHTTIPPLNEAQPPTSTPPKATKDFLPGYDNEGNLQTVAYEQDDGTWNVYTSTTSNVTTDPNATKTNVPNKAAVQAQMGATGQRVAPASTTARTQTGGGGGSNTANQTGPATLTPNGPAKDLVLKRGRVPKWVPKVLGGGAQRIMLQSYFQNRFAGFQDFGRMVKEVMAAHNEHLPDELKIDDQAILRNTHAANKIAEQEKKYAEPIAEQGASMEKKFGLTQEEIDKDVTNLHFEERAAHKQQMLDPDTDWTTGEAKRSLDKLKSDQLAAKTSNDNLRKNSPAYFAEVEKLAMLYKQMGDATLDMAQAYHLMPKATVDRIKGTYKYWVPIQIGERTVSGKTATGSTAMGTVPFQRIRENMIRTVMRGEQNNIAGIVYQLASKMFNVLDENGKRVFDFSTPAKTKIKIDPRDFTLGYGVDTVSPLNPRAVQVFVGDGQRVYMSIEDDAIFNSLNIFSGAQKQSAKTAAIGAVATMSHIMALGKTAANPGFAVFNLLRDVATTAVQLPKEYSRARFFMHLASPQVWGSAFYSAFAEAFGKEAKGVYKQAKEAGGLVTQQAYAGLDPINAAVNGKFSPSTKDTLKQRGRQAREVLMAFSQALESGTRLAIFNTVNEHHLAQGMTTQAAEHRAAIAAKTTTVNFETRGTVPLGPLYLFANAKIQGLATYYDKLVNEKNPYTQAATVGLMGLGLMAAAIGYRDSDKDKDGKSRYGKMQQNKRDSMIIFHEGATGIPIPQELAPFYAIGNTIGDGIWGDTQSTPAQMWSRFMRVVAQTVSPLNTPQQDITGYKSNLSDYLLRTITPSVLLPVYDLSKNENTFGNKIVQNKDKLQAGGSPMREMYSKNENTLAVNAAKALYQVTGIDVAPAQLKYLAAAFDPTGYTNYWSDVLGSNKPPSYPGQVDTRGGFDLTRPIAKRFDTTASSFADDDNYNLAKQETLEAKYYTTNPNALRRGTPTPDTQKLAALERIFADTDKQISAIYKDFKARPQATDLQINTMKQQLQQQALRQYYHITGKGGG